MLSIKLQMLNMYYLPFVYTIEDCLLNMLGNLECKGRFKMFNNGFCCHLMNDAFAYVAQHILSPYGYRVTEKVRLRISPRTHISIVTKSELEQLPEERTNTVRMLWGGKGALIIVMFI